MASHCYLCLYQVHLNAQCSGERPLSGSIQKRVAAATGHLTSFSQKTRLYFLKSHSLVSLPWQLCSSLVGGPESSLRYCSCCSYHCSQTIPIRPTAETH